MSFDELIAAISNNDPEIIKIDFGREVISADDFMYIFNKNMIESVPHPSRMLDKDFISLPPLTSENEFLTLIDALKNNVHVKKLKIVRLNNQGFSWILCWSCR